MIESIKSAGIVLGFVTALIGLLWGTLGMPTIATGSDLKELDRKVEMELKSLNLSDAEAQIDQYTTEQRGLFLVAPKPGDEFGLTLWREWMARAETKKEHATSRARSLKAQ